MAAGRQLSRSAYQVSERRSHVRFRGSVTVNNETKENVSIEL